MTSPVRAPRPTPRRIEAPEPVRRHLKAVPDLSRPTLRPRRSGAVGVVVLAVVFGSLMASAVFHGLLVSGQSNLDRIDTKIQEERTLLAQEKLELADLQSPARIAEAARDRGMVPADQQHWITPGTNDPPIVTGVAATEPADELAASDNGGSAQ